MKRFSGRMGVAFITAGLVLLQSSAVTAQNLNYEQPEDVFCISFNQCISGNDYVLMLVEPGTKVSSLNENNLLFIDQYTAGADPQFDIAIIYPDFESCDAYVSGTFSNSAASPHKIGSYSASRLPEQLRTIEAGAFENVPFTHVYLGQDVKEIGSRAFAGCSSMVYIYIPSSVTTIASDAFIGCSNVMIGCEKNSKASTFAASKGINYILIDE